MRFGDAHSAERPLVLDQFRIRHTRGACLGGLESDEAQPGGCAQMSDQSGFRELGFGHPSRNIVEPGIL